MFLILFLILLIPSVQTRLGQYATKTINKEFKTNITIGKVGLQLNGDVELKNILIKDYKKDTLISAKELNTSIINFRNLYKSKLNFGDIDLQNVIFNLKTYKNETDTNLDVFVDRFETDNPNTKPSGFLFSSSDLTITNGAFNYADENLEHPNILKFYNLNANTTDFLINGPNVSTRINTFSFETQRGVKVTNLQTNFTYTKKHMLFDKLNIVTAQSKLKGNLRFDYKREDLKNFTNKVNITADFENSVIALTELNAYFNAFGKNQFAYLNTQLSGTLNNLTARNLKVNTTRNTKIDGNITFKNIFSKNNSVFSLQGDFKKLSSNYTDLIALMPSLLRKSLPSVMHKLGNFSMNGTTYITEKNITANLDINTEIGKVNSNLKLTNINAIDNANYEGNLVFEAFNIGALIDDDTIKDITADLEVIGKGFTLESLNTAVKGKIAQLNYNNYNYQNIDISGDLGNKVFNGKLNSLDPNLKLSFNGLVDFSEPKAIYNFNANVNYANLAITNFVTRDKVSVFKGQVSINAKGSTLDDLVGKIQVKNTQYKNQDNSYGFKDFDITSMFKNNQRTIAINSPEIISGNIQGNFYIDETLKLFENALGNIYANYEPHVLKPNQNLKFDFNIYSKIATVFFKDLELGPNTVIKGSVKTNAKGFQLNFNSPTIKYNNYYANNINLNIDNGNPVYNAFIEVDSMSFGAYSTKDFTLINSTKRDTLFVKTEFKGGAKNNDRFNLNLFYTIDSLNNSIVGFKTSKFKIKNYDWVINKHNSLNSKVVFDKTLTNFNIAPTLISHNDQQVLLSGVIKDKNKDVQLTFNNVFLDKITPDIDSLKLNGRVNGKLQWFQKQGTYLPKSNLQITDFTVNNTNLGLLKAYAVGEKSITNYNIDVTLTKDATTSFSATGNLNFDSTEPQADLNIALNNFLLDPLNPLGADVITKIRGQLSGDAKVLGPLKNPDINGQLRLNNAGLAIPYLNVDYTFDNYTNVTLSKQQFLFNSVNLFDTKFNSNASLTGAITHSNFSKWNLDLKIDSDRLLVLDTTESEDALYYGTGFLDGKAEILGPTDQLVINVNGSTAKGTDFNIPLNDAESFGDNSYIYFITPKDKQARLNGEITERKEIKGLELNFDLNINKNASIEIVIDKESGSTLKGRGEGGLRFLINTNDTFKMWGDFFVYEGVYKFKYQNLVEKNFSIQPDSYIVWEGEPLQAQIDIKALYQGNANPSILLDNPINQTIPIHVETVLTGQLEQPDIDFVFDFPTVNSAIKSELDYRLASKEERQNQALFFLATGNFASGINNINFTGTIAERLSGIVNNLLGSENSKLNVGLDFELGQDTPELQTNNRVGVTLQTQISDRILVNGKVGVPFGTAQQTTITGDVQIDWLLNQDGTLRATVFNRENVIRNFGDEIGFTQGLGLSYSVEFNTFKEFLNIIFKPKSKPSKPKTTAPKNSTPNESLPSFIKMNK